MKYNTSGTVQWAQSGGGPDYDVANGIAVDGSGNVYITGSFHSDKATFGSTTLTNTISSDAMFIAKYNISGILQWAKGVTGSSQGYGIVTNAAGTRVYTVGTYTPNAKFGNTILTTGQYLLWMYGE